MVAIPTQTYLNLPKEKQQRITDAAVNEFSVRRFREANLSNIIKEAKIARGSFYQYFKDKLDIYKYVFTIIGQKKMEYLSEDLKNPMNLAFFDLFRELYHMGLKFALDNPKYVKITNLLMSQRDNLFKEVFEKNLDIAKNYYREIIKRDQDEGRMDPNIDPETLINLVINMTTNVTLESLGKEGETFNQETYKEEIEKIIYIFEKGIKGN